MGQSHEVRKNTQPNTTSEYHHKNKCSLCQHKRQWATSETHIEARGWKGNNKTRSQNSCVSCCETACFTPYLSAFYPLHISACCCCCFFLYISCYFHAARSAQYGQRKIAVKTYWTSSNIKKISRAYFYYIQWGKHIVMSKKHRITKNIYTVYVGGALKRRTQNIPQSMA